MRQLVTFTPAWDRRHPDPNRNHGVHGVELRMVLRGRKGATQFVLFTGWHWLNTSGGLLLQAPPVHPPIPADLGYHSPHPRYPGQQPMDCDLFPTGCCYYDGSGLAAQRVYQRLLREGDQGVWAELLEEYRALFEPHTARRWGAALSVASAWLAVQVVGAALPWPWWLPAQVAIVVAWGWANWWATIPTQRPPSPGVDLRRGRVGWRWRVTVATRDGLVWGPWWFAWSNDRAAVAAGRYSGLPPAMIAQGRFPTAAAANGDGHRPTRRPTPRRS